MIVAGGSPAANVLSAQPPDSRSRRSPSRSAGWSDTFWAETVDTDPFRGAVRVVAAQQTDIEVEGAPRAACSGQGRKEHCDREHDDRQPGRSQYDVEPQS